MNKSYKGTMWDFDDNAPPGVLVRFHRKINHVNKKENKSQANWEALSYFDHIEFTLHDSISKLFLITGDIGDRDHNFETQYLSLAKMLTPSGKACDYQNRYFNIFDRKSDFPDLMVISGLRLSKKIYRNQELIDSLYAIIMSQNKNGRIVECELFNTLGFGEIAIIFRTNSFLSVLKALYQVGVSSLKSDDIGFFYSVPAYNHEIDKEMLKDLRSLRINSLISSKNISRSDKEFNKINVSPLMFFGQYDFGVEISNGEKSDFQEIKEKFNLESNEYINFLLAYEYKKIEGTYNDRE